MIVSPGTRLGPYEIVSPLGAGGMGEVWRARDTRLDRSVAIKLIPADLAANPQIKLRFEREAKTISQLEHPHVCRLYDVGETGSDAGGERLSYLVMELVDGESLADRLTRGPLALSEVLRYGTEIAEALAAAHQAGIVHRDLKPGNVMITRSGAKLLDFGLSKMARPAVMTSPDSETVHADRSSSDRPLTEKGTILGTFQYMAPEQLEGIEADARSDIFALGCVLYEMLTGSRAFDGKTRTSLIAAIIASEPRPIAQLQPLTPPPLEHVVATCLRKDPERRWQSARDVAHELRWIEALPAATDHPVVRNRWRLPLIALGVVALVAAGAGFGRYSRTPATVAAVHSSILPPKGIEVARPTGDGEGSVISPDGRLVAFIARESDGRRRLWVRPLDSSEARPVGGTESARYPFWSPDSRMLAFFADGRLKKVALDGSPPVTVCPVASNPLPGDWNEDGVILFSTGSGLPLSQVSASGGEPIEITVLDRSLGETTHRWARFLPDGKSFLYTAGSHSDTENSEVNAVYAARLGSPERKLILRTLYNVEYTEGQILFVRDDTLFAQRFDPARHELAGEPIPLFRNVDTTPDSFYAAFSVSDDGRLVYIAGQERRKKELVWLDANGRPGEQVMPPGEYGGWRVSPDGRLLAITIIDPSTGANIWLKDLARGSHVRLTLGEGGSGEPVWSPDGKKIAYAGRDGIYLMDANGQTAPEILWQPGVWAGAISWSPDGNHLGLWTFDPRSRNKYDVIVRRVEDGSLIPVANTIAAEYAFDFSPDGRWMMYASDVSGRSEIYVVSFPDLQRRHQISNEGADGASWKSSEEIWYRTNHSEIVSVRIADNGGTLEISEPVSLFRDERLIGLEFMPGRNEVLAMRRVGETEPAELRLITDWTALVGRNR
jgi:eukaryotic-like serine/threonine-protein kinase